MKVRFKSEKHKKTFTEFINRNVKNPYRSRCDSTGCRTVSPKGGARMRRQQSETMYFGGCLFIVLR